MEVVLERKPLQRHYRDETSPIGAIQGLIDSLIERVERYILEENFSDQDTYLRLRSDCDQRTHDLDHFLKQLVLNELELPLDEIMFLKQRAEVLKHKLKEINFYLAHLNSQPNNVRRLVQLRKKVFGRHEAEDKKSASVQQMIAKLSHPQLHKWLKHQFDDANWYGWGFNVTEIANTVHWVNTYFTTHETHSYADFLKYLVPKTSFMPFAQACSEFFKPTIDYANLSDELKRIRQAFKSYTQAVMQVSNHFTLMEKQTDPLKRKSLESLDEICQHYETTVLPRAINFREVVAHVETLQALAVSLKTDALQLHEEISAHALQKALQDTISDEEQIKDMLKLRGDLLTASKKLDMAISRLIEQSALLRAKLSEGLTVTESTMNDMTYDVDNAPKGSLSSAFFDQKSEPGSYPFNPTKRHRDVLLKSAQRMGNVTAA